MSEIQIAPHLQRALESMSKDLSIDPQALVNQAVFAWLRINGYVAPGAAVVAAAPQPVAELGTSPTAPTGTMRSASSLPPVEVAPVVVAPIAVVEPVVVAPPPPPEPVVPKPIAVTATVQRHVPAPEPVVEAPDPTPPSPSPVVASEPPVSSSPSGGQVAALARMKEIAADLDKLTRPWPDWVAPLDEEEEEDEQPSDQDQDQPPPSASQEEEEPAPDAAAAKDDREFDPSSLDHPSEPEAPEPPEPQRSLNEPDPDEPPADSTVVLRSVPIVLYLEREGEEPVRVDVERFVIGRDPRCDMVIDSPRVSREHVALTRSGIRYFIEDLNSSNGTWFGEDRVTKRELESGDVISLGNEPVTFTLRGE